MRYRCTKCGATKTIRQPQHMTSAEFVYGLPADLPCGFRDCDGRAIPAIRRD